MNTVQVGAFFFGMVIGWFTYFVNRYRSSVKLADVAGIVGAIGGAAVLDLFPAKSELFGAYGIGLGAGFFLYFLVLLIFVGVDRRTVRKKKDAAGRPAFSVAWFLDGRRPRLAPEEIEAGATPSRAMSGNGGIPDDYHRQG